MVLRGGKRQDVTAVGHDDEARFLAGEEFLDHHLVSGGAELPAEHRLCGADRLRDRVGDDHPLAARQTARLHHQRGALRAHPVLIESVAAEGGGARRGNTVAAQELLGEGLRALEPRCIAARSEAAESRRGEGVDDAGDERRFRSDDRQIDALGTRELYQRGSVLGGDADIAHPRLGGRAAVAGRHQHLADACRGGAFPGERVLATASTDDQYLHEGTPGN